MGTGPKGSRKRLHAKKKQYRKSHGTKRRTRDIDQCQDDVINMKNKKLEINDDLPGQGQYYCIPCARYFISAAHLQRHVRTKVHKRRIKDIKQEKYTQESAELAAGKTKEILISAEEERRRRQLKKEQRMNIET